MTCLEGIIQENNPKLQEQFEAFKKAVEKLFTYKGNRT